MCMCVYAYVYAEARRADRLRALTEAMSVEELDDGAKALLQPRAQVQLHMEESVHTPGGPIGRRMTWSQGSQVGEMGWGELLLDCEQAQHTLARLREQRVRHEQRVRALLLRIQLAERLPIWRLGLGVRMSVQVWQTAERAWHIGERVAYVMIVGTVPRSTAACQHEA